VLTARYELTLWYRLALAFGVLSGNRIANCDSHSTDTKTTDGAMIAYEHVCELCVTQTVVLCCGPKSIDTYRQENVRPTQC